MAQVIPDTIDEALAAWDAGEEVQTVEMGGLGDGYEMAIQCVAFELMRALRDDPDLRRMNEETPDNGSFPQEFKDKLDTIVSGLDAKDANGRYGMGGLSGAQVGAARNIAVNLTRHGYANAREKVPDRLIFVRRQDPMALYNAEQASA
jgi:hypothetical protein